MKSTWQDNSIQFPRFIAEANAAGAFTNQVLLDMAREMDLNSEDLVEILDRAVTEWDKIKAKTLRR